MANGIAEKRREDHGPPVLAGGLLRAGRIAYRGARRVMSSLLPAVVHDRLRRLARGKVRDDAAPSRRFGLLPEMFEAARLLADQYEAAARQETTEADVWRKIERYQILAGQRRLDRVAAYRELARLEEKRGNDLTAVAYHLRVMRLAGQDYYGDLGTVTSTLRQRGFPAEADASEAMFGPPDAAPTRCHRMLKEAFVRHRQAPPSVEFETVEDWRATDPVRVAVIVSLYRAAAKLPAFLTALQEQTLFRARQAEVVFVDSGSPDDEYGALTRTELRLPFPYLYVRTRQRETIQTAWNRGILLARAPYLSFLGADETLTPPALEILAGRLDADSELDWVQANSVATEVDGRGAFVREIMTYDRSGYTPFHPYLDTTYLSWVGALYRRSIHDRFGYYDGSFGAAGDTEFKNRVLPYLKTCCSPQMLGVFRNYPEERATASPRAEIEDLRAWYLHRTAGGVRYAFEDRDPAEVERLLLLTLYHRKSYTRHVSTDVGYARTLADYLATRDPRSPVFALADGIADLDDAYRTLDWAEARNLVGQARAVRQARETAARVQAEHRATTWLPDAAYATHNDNRREQHWWFW